jgi:2-isopropylmalate synthase
MPWEVERFVQAARDLFRETVIGVHTHNDSELAVANTLAGVRAGATHVQGTINGIGERCGNANLVSIIPVLAFKMNRETLSPKKMQELTQVSHYVAEVCNLPINIHQPFTGRAAFAHKGGVHINAMMKSQKTYEHMDPALVGNHRRYLISELGGKTNVVLKARELKIDFDKESPEARNVLTEIQRLENEGYQFEAAEASLELLMHRLTGRSKKFFEIESVAVRAEGIGKENPTSVAEVKLTAKGKTHFEVADGDGPVNALDRALRNALRTAYPVIDQTHLTDFKVRVVNSEAGTAAKVRVFIEFQDEKAAWVTVGVHANIVEASWKALTEAIEYKLFKSQQRVS